MSAVNKRYSHSFAQTTDDSSTPPQQRDDDDDAASSVRADQAVTTSDGLFDDPTYPIAAPDELLPPPDFRPFFTLIENPDTSEHHHPSVHYIFSDDNPDFLTSAVVDGMNQELVGTSLQVANNRERMILVDIAPDGKTVNEAQSLSQHWQILRTTVSQAPSWADEVSRKDIPGLMLNIQGMESGKLRSQAHRRKNSQEDTMARVEAMVGSYGACLSTLEGLVKKDVLDDEQDEPAGVAKAAATQEDEQGTAHD
ncbi:hypothetical protein M436DRAFT_53231 [Aureobasidium namibiae CBS 147.97]|uniref:Uncharacterized protein n=1 Tax=Aureobasidium namibiae CBS 147.97 TaxID=1043004 RepID=A0A074WCG0_9PEZI